VRARVLFSKEISMNRTRPSMLGSIVVSLLAIAAPVFAGPPLLCFPFETGGAKTLPMKGGDWKSVDPKYDVSHLTTDTLALLTPATPVVARMETIRRATIYASTHPPIASELLANLQARAAISDSAAASAVFDLGYLIETYKQATFMFSSPVKGLGEMDGYQLVLKASALQNDPAMEFGAAVIAQGSANAALRAKYRGHLDRAMAGAKSDAALNATVAKHFRITAELR
jgi:hypothetical protein